LGDATSEFLEIWIVSASQAGSSSTIIPEGIARKPHKFNVMLQNPPPKWWK
jgi:hypothetical protein